MTNTNQPVKELMSRREAAAYLGICKTTLDRQDIAKTKIGRRVLYRREVLEKWILQNTKESA